MFSQFICELCFCFVLSLSAFDECKHYELLNDRQRAAGVHRGNTLKCDQKDLVTPKWYRFTGAAGTQMPTSCVPQHYCGTHAPGWLDGAHPARVGQIVNAKVCFHWSRSCCNWHANIQIKRCHGFFVYKLARTPVCWLRYCGNAGFGMYCMYVPIKFYIHCLYKILLTILCIQVVVLVCRSRVALYYYYS